MYFISQTWSKLNVIIIRSITFFQMHLSASRKFHQSVYAVYRHDKWDDDAEDSEIAMEYRIRNDQLLEQESGRTTGGLHASTEYPDADNIADEANDA